MAASNLREARAQFENGWREITQVYGVTLHPKHEKLVKGIAWNTYLRGRTDEMRRQLQASHATALLSRLDGNRGRAKTRAQLADDPVGQSRGGADDASPQ